MPNGHVVGIQNLAAASNQALSARFDQDQQSLGGDLFLGRSYNETPRVFLGYNPGGQGKYVFKTSLCERNFWDHSDPPCDNWANCKFFVNAAPGLHDWLDRATVGFCSPWRTKGEKEFKRLNTSLDGELYRRSGEIVNMLIKDHREKFSKMPITVIVVGKCSLDLIARKEFLDFDARKVMDECGTSGMFRCRKVQPFPWISVYQVPHFSRASEDRLTQGAQWVAAHLQLK